MFNERIGQRKIGGGAGFVKATGRCSVWSGRTSPAASTIRYHEEAESIQGGRTEYADPAVEIENRSFEGIARQAAEAEGVLPGGLHASEEIEQVPVQRVHFDFVFTGGADGEPGQQQPAVPCFQGRRNPRLRNRVPGRSPGRLPRRSDRSGPRSTPPGTASCYPRRIGIQAADNLHGRLFEDGDLIDYQGGRRARDPADFLTQRAHAKPVFGVGKYFRRAGRREVTAQVSYTCVPVLRKSLYDSDFGIIHSGGVPGGHRIRPAGPADNDLRQTAIDIQHGVHDDGFAFGRTEERRGIPLPNNPDGRRYRRAGRPSERA